MPDYAARHIRSRGLTPHAPSAGLGTAQAQGLAQAVGDVSKKMGTGYSGLSGSAMGVSTPGNAQTEELLPALARYAAMLGKRRMTPAGEPPRIGRY